MGSEAGPSEPDHQPTAPGPPSRLDQRTRAVVAVCAFGGTVSLLDSTIVNLALGQLSAELDATLDTVQWVVSGYLLAMAASVPVVGWAARRWGGRRVYVASLWGFALASLSCGLAASIEQLITFRVVQGAVGGLLAVGQIILVREVTTSQLARAMSAATAPMVLGPALGPVLGGAVLTSAGWRWLFLVSVPICVTGAVFAARVLTWRHPDVPGAVLDVPGLLVASAGLVTLMYAFAELGRPTGSTPGGVVAVTAGLLLISTFVVRSLRREQPLLDVRLFRRPVFATASVTLFCVGAVVYGGVTLMPLYLQQLRGLDGLATGLLVMPQGVGAGLGIWLSGRLIDRVGGGRTAVLGALLVVTSLVPFVMIAPATSYGLLIPALALRGLGTGLMITPATTTTFRQITPSETSDASPLFFVVQRVGGSVGAALFVTALATGLGAAGPDPMARAHAYGQAFWWVFAAAALAGVAATVLAFYERRWRSRYDLGVTNATGQDAPPTG